MSLIADLQSLERSQKSAIWASYLGWTLDAFDFALMLFMLKAIAAEFGSDIKTVAVTLTLAARPFGALSYLAGTNPEAARASHAERDR